MREAVRFAQLPAALAIAALIAAVTFPGRAELVLRVAALAIAGLVLVRLVLAVQAALPPRRGSAFDAALRGRRRQPERLPELAKLEREVTLGATTAFDLHYRLRPTLRRIAGELLSARRGIDLDAQPGAARAALGDEAWELVRADREPPEDRFGRGVDLARLGRVVTSLEAL